jgi:hypothetical protein
MEIGMAWGVFVIAYIVSAVVLFAPGYFVLRILDFDSVKALCASPAISVAIIAMLGIVYSLVGVFSNWVSCALVPILVLAAGYAASLNVKDRKFAVSVTAFFNSREWPYLLAYIVVGVSFAALFFAGNIDGADAFQPDNDNSFHLSLITTFVASGDYSMLHASVYPIWEASPSIGSGFYPAGFHCVAAVVVSILGASASLVENAVSAAIISLVFPLGNYLMLREILRNHPYRSIGLYAGAFLGLMLIAYPWRFLTWGPLFPNLLGMSMVSAVVGIACSVDKIFGRSLFWYCSRGAACLLTVIGLASAHPNCLFTLMILLVPYVAFRIASQGTSATNFGGFTVKNCIQAIVFLFAAALLWLSLYRFPALQGTVWFGGWSSFESSFTMGLFDAMSLKLTGNSQPLFAILCSLGFIASIRNWRQWGYLSLSFAFVLVQFAACASDDGVLRHLLAGFWYTDSNRTAANVALAAIPLIDLGFVAAVRFLLGLDRRPLSFPPRHSWSVMATLLACVLLVPVIGRVADRQDGFTLPFDFKGAYSSLLQSKFGQWSAKGYDIGEVRFVSKVEKIVGPDNLVINIPNDGSAFSYALQGLNVFYKNCDLSYVSSGGQTWQSEIIRTKLNQISSDEEVRDAVASVGAQYVLVLDEGAKSGDMSRTLPPYDASQWSGITSIDEQTPGFEVVLSDGDMCLYKIDS